MATQLEILIATAPETGRLGRADPISRFPEGIDRGYDAPLLIQSLFYHILDLAHSRSYLIMG